MQEQIESLLTREANRIVARSLEFVDPDVRISLFSPTLSKLINLPYWIRKALGRRGVETAHMVGTIGLLPNAVDGRPFAIVSKISHVSGRTVAVSLNKAVLPERGDVLPIGRPPLNWEKSPTLDKVIWYGAVVVHACDADAWWGEALCEESPTLGDIVRYVSLERGSG